MVSAMSHAYGLGLSSISAFAKSAWSVADFLENHELISCPTCFRALFYNYYPFCVDIAPFFLAFISFFLWKGLADMDDPGEAQRNEFAAWAKNSRVFLAPG